MSFPAGNCAARLRRAWQPGKIVFSGVGKTRAELELGLSEGIGQFNIESREEGRELAEVAARDGMTAQAALRVNPDVDAGTHDKISTGKAENKFGVPLDTGDRGLCRTVCAGRAEPARRGIAYRQPAARPGRRWKPPSEKSARWSRTCGPPATPSPMSIWAAVWACPIARARTRPRLPHMATW